MKNFKRFNFLLLLTIFVFVSCDKDEDEDPSIEQQRIETLAASAWTLTSTTLNGVEIDIGGTLISHMQTYGYCTLANGNCNGSNSYILELDNNGGTIYGGASFTYKMHEEGTKMTINTTETRINGVTTLCTSGCENVFTVLEWSNTKHVLETVVANGDVWTRTMERI